MARKVFQRADGEIFVQEKNPEQPVKNPVTGKMSKPKTFLLHFQNGQSAKTNKDQSTVPGLEDITEEYIRQYGKDSDVKQLEAEDDGGAALVAKSKETKASGKPKS